MKTFTTCAEKKAKQILNLLQGYTKGIRLTAILVLLLMGTANAWAEPAYPYASLYEVYMSYSYSGNNGEYTYKNTDNGHVAVNLGTLSSDFKITSIYMKVYKNENDWGRTGNICQTFLKYKINNGTEQSIEPKSWSGGTWADERHKYEISMTSSTTIAKYNGASGNYNFTHYFKATGDKEGSDCTDEFYISNNGANYLFTYTIAPPSVKDFTVTPSGNVISGSGTENDPYIIKHDGSLTLTLSGSQNHTDANSTIQYNTSGTTWNTTKSRTISNITSTDVKNVTVKARYKNNSDANLCGAESSQTIHYRSEQVYTVTFNANGHGTAPAAQTVSQGSKATQPAAPTATGYTFGGWYKEAGCTNAFDFNTAINADITLYAKWTPVPTLEISTNQQYLRTGKDKLQLSITYASIPEGYTYRVHATPEAYFNGNVDGDNVDEVSISGNGKTTFVSHGYLAQNTYTVEVILWNNNAATNIKSNQISIIVEPQLSVQTRARFNNQINTTAAEHPQPEWVYPSQHVEETITASEPKPGYTFAGWEANDNNLIEFDQPNSRTTIVKSKVNGNNNAVAYANYTETKHNVTIQANNNTYGTVSPESISVGQHTASSTITATPNAGCRFVNWTYTTGITIADEKSPSTTITATQGGTLTANFEENKYAVQVSVAAGQGSWGSVSTNSTSVGSVSAQQITATANTNLGYVFDRWVLSDGITITSGDANSATIQIKATKAGSLTAHFRGENRLQNVYLMVNSDNPADPNWQFYKLPGESGNTVTLTKTITKSDYHSNGYKFGFQIYHSDWGDKWWKNSADNDTKMDAHNCTGWKFAFNSNNYKTYIDLNVSGEYTFTLTNSTTYDQQALSITYPDKSFIEGAFATAWDEDAYPLTENGDIQTVTIPITSKKDVEFRLVSHGKLFGSNTKILVASNSQTLSEKNMESDGAVMTLGAYVEGDYTFSYNKSTKVLTVTYPSVNQLQVYSANPAHDAAKKNWDWDSQNGDVYTKTLSLNANTTYTFKAVVNSDFYGKNETTLTRQNQSVALNTEGGNVTIKTDIAGDYTFTFNTSTKALSVTYPEAYTINYGVGTSSNGCGTVAIPDIASGTLVAAGTDLTLSATPNLGYKFVGWYSEADCNTQVSTANPYNFPINSDTTLYAKFEERDLYIHTDIIGWERTPAQMTQDDNNKAVYTYTATLGKLPSGQDGDAWNFGYHFHFVNTQTNPNDNIAYNWYGVQDPTFEGASIDGVHLTFSANPTIQFGLTRKSDVTITLTLQSPNDDPKPTVRIEAIPYYNITLDQANATSQSNPTSVEVKWNEAMPKLTTTPNRTGYNFGGYYADLNDENTKYYNADGTSAKAWDINDDKTLYAKWTAIPYSITYELYGGENHASNPETYNVTQEVQLQTPTKENCYFVGWYTNSNLTGDPVTTISAGTTGDMTFYAKWASLTITSYPEYLIPSQRLQLGIDYENIPENYFYVVKVGNAVKNNNIDGISQPKSPISGTGSTTYTAFDQINSGTYTVVVGLYRIDIDWNANNAIPLASATIEITVETQYEVGVFCRTDNAEGNTAGGSIAQTPVYASQNVGAEVVATANPGYRFDQWKYIPGHDYDSKITFTDAKASTTTIYATDGGQIYANFVARGLSINPSWGWGEVWYFPMTQSDNKLVYTYNTLSSEPSVVAGLNAGEHNFNIREENTDLAYNFDDVEITYSGEITGVTSHDPQDQNSNIMFTLSNRSEVTITLELANEGKPTVHLQADRYYTITYKTGYGENTICWEGWLKSTDNIKIADAIERPGYTFTGWNSEIDGTGEAPDASKQMGTQDRTYYAQWTPATYTVTLDNKGGSGVESVQATYGSAMPTITIPTKDGHLFLGYYDGDNGTGTQYYNADGTSAKNWDKTYDLTLHAKWLSSSDCIFFYNTLGWQNVYVYFYNGDYWDASKGSGAKTGGTYQGYAKMTQIAETNIWYVNASGKSTNYLVFGKENQDGYQNFDNTEVVRRGDYNNAVPMYVPINAAAEKLNKHDGKEALYYNKGYWMNYPTNTGYTLKIYNQKEKEGATEWRSIPFEYSEDMVMPLTLSVSGMEGGKTYGFKILRADNTWYSNIGTMTTNSSGDVGQTAWEFTKEVNDNCGLTTTAPGTYVFTLKYGKDRNSNYNYLVGVEYPASVGDYRLAYQDNAHPFHPGHLLKKRDGKDTISFFVHHNLSPVIMLQQVEEINPNTGAITWTTKKTYALTANQAYSEDPGQAMMPGRRNADEVILHIGGEHMDGIDTTGIYNFVLEQTDSIATLQNTATKYTGNFYIRTDAAAGGWGDFRQAGNKMTYSSYAESNSDFNHYFVEWINQNKNVKFTIANDYSYCISDTLDGDAIVGNGWLPANANVRFGWDSRNNKLTRAYIAGSGFVGDRFLVVTGDNSLKNAEGETLTAGPQGDTDQDKADSRYKLNDNEDIFKDLGNWVYQVDVRAQHGTKINLTALYNGTIQYFKGAEGDPSYPLLASTDSVKPYKIRMIYNFKTNHLVVAWMPDSLYNANGDEHLGIDMLLIRRNQDQATQIQLNSEADTINNIKTAYAVMTFTKDFVKEDTISIHARKHYWVSFPFDVKISDVFGFSEYKDHWIMQAYDGAGRAANGLWADTDTYWRYITNANYVMRKGQGYVLTLDVKKMLELDPVFSHTDEVSLYFPSRGELDTITSYVPTADTVPAHPCTIERENRKIYDSHWNMIGVPGFADIANFETTAPGNYLKEQELGYQGDSLSFYYAYKPAENSYEVRTGDTTLFQSMYSYMVQFAGTINWRSKEVTYNGQQQLAARRNSDYAEPEKVSFRLELAQGEEKADQTFVQLQQEGATSEFDMNLDLTKIINSGANIYTLAGESRIQSAGNALPMGEAVVVPVGVKIDAEGEYTFRMPDGTEGMVVELIDYETYNRTNLLLTDYTVTLPKGTSENRFALHIQPQKDVVTSLENIGEGVNNGEAVNKYLIDGKLIIRTADGVVYDAQGKRL